MKDILPIIAIVLTIISIVIVAVRNSNNNKVAEEITKYFISGQFDLFDQLINSKKANGLPKFNKLFFMMNKSIAINDHQKTEEYLNSLENIKLSNAEKDALYTRAFHYYLNTKNNDNASKYHSYLAELNSPSFKDVDRYYDTYIASGYKYLDESLKQLENLNLMDKPALELLISNMYANKNDEANVNKYVELAQEHLEQIQKRKK